MSYIEIIYTAITVCPIIAFILSGIYFIIQYKKYGSVSMFRTLLLYTFLLYCICAYFLVILPLPSIESVAARTGDTYQLVPFNVVKVFINESGFNITKPTTYLRALTSHAFLQPTFNFLLLLPLGIYLRYYFKMPVLKACRVGFLTTVFFELTQFSGLYGIYPRPYRLLDVDDLMLNFSGCMLGYLIAPLLVLALPSRADIDEKSKRLGQNITLMRRVFAKAIDTLIVTIMYCITFLFVNIALTISGQTIVWNTHKLSQELVLKFILTYIAFSILYQLVCIVTTRGRTIGKYVLGIHICDMHNKHLSRIRILFRYFLFLITSYVIPATVIYVYFTYLINNIVSAIFCGILLGVTVLYTILRTIISIFSSKYTYFTYERISMTYQRAKSKF